MDWFSSIADYATIVASVIAVAGVVAIWLSRPRVAVDVQVDNQNSASISVRHRKGTAPIRSLHYALIGLNEAGESRYGDGMGLWAPEIVEGSWALLSLYDPAEVQWSGELRDFELRRDVTGEYGVLVGLSWQRPLLPWLRAYRTVIWPLTVRREGGPMQVISGRAAKRAFERASKSPA